MSIVRSAGILMPISSLPSKYGIGTLGKEAYNFADFLAKAQQSYWQVLPIGHTSYGDSPYQAFSSFAGNPYFIDLDMLVEDGLLEAKDLKKIKVKNAEKVDYGYLYETRYPLLYKAYETGIKKFDNEFDQFCVENRSWLEDYALFMALKKHFKMASWLEWPDENIKKRNHDTLNYYREELNDDIRFYEFIQFLFYKQFFAFKKYVNGLGIKIIGDLPIYIAMDSCEVWADPIQFKLDMELMVPKEVAGVPPDYFSANGQLWGNPLYNWEYMKTTGYKWWIDRIDGVRKCFDVIRIDHFRGFEEYWAVPYGEKTAKNGHWDKGPSIDFVGVLRDWFHDVDFIAEDLGIIDEKVTDLLKQSGFPGMRVLEFGFTPDGSSYHCVQHHVKNGVCYIATHDNKPIMGFLDTCKKNDLAYAKLIYGLNKEEGYNFGFIRAGMGSVCDLSVAQMQDYLGLGAGATMNAPGTLGNWSWRMKKGANDNKLCEKIKRYTHAFNRDSNKIAEIAENGLKDKKK